MSSRCKIILLAVSLSLVILVISYFLGNRDKPSEGDSKVRLLENVLRQKNRFARMGNHTDECVLVNTSYDKMLIPKYDEDGMYLGVEAVTDRGLLADFLHQLHLFGGYRLVVIDIDLSNVLLNGQDSMRSEDDRRLVRQILSMDRVLLSQSVDEDGNVIPFADSSLESISGVVCYNRTFDISDALSIPLTTHGKKSVPLLMAEQVPGDHLIQKGPLYFYNGMWGLCRKKVPPVPYVEYQDCEVGESGDMKRMGYDNLGADIMSDPELIPIKCADKIVMVGDFENDVHDTFWGAMPGAVILLNAYFSILHRWHMVNWFFMLLKLLVYSVVLMPRNIVLGSFRQVLLSVRRFLIRCGGSRKKSHLQIMTIALVRSKWGKSILHILSKLLDATIATTLLYFSALYVFHTEYYVALDLLLVALFSVLIKYCSKRFIYD